MPVDGCYDLILVVFNTFLSLTSRELQQECLDNVRLHLTKKGRFLIEAFVPDLARFTDGQAVRATSVRDAEVRLDVSKHDRATQRITTQHVVITESGIRLYPVRVIYTIRKI